MGLDRSTNLCVMLHIWDCWQLKVLRYNIQFHTVCISTAIYLVIVRCVWWLCLHGEDSPQTTVRGNCQTLHSFESLSLESLADEGTQIQAKIEPYSKTEDTQWKPCMQGIYCDFSQTRRQTNSAFVVSDVWNPELQRKRVAERNEKLQNKESLNKKKRDFVVLRQAYLCGGGLPFQSVHIALYFLFVNFSDRREAAAHTPFWQRVPSLSAEDFHECTTLRIKIRNKISDRFLTRAAT